VAGYPDRPIKLLVGFGAGTDIVARILAPKMSLWRTEPARAA
jgi:tripartite-type tricarboxylate transporter receptor subunit TctC